MARSVIESNVMEYTGIKDISGYTCIVIGEDENSYYEKEFRYSSDKILWSDYKSLTNKNLSTVKIYDDTVYIQYRFNHFVIQDKNLCFSFYSNSNIYC